MIYNWQIADFYAFVAKLTDIKMDTIFANNTRKSVKDSIYRNLEQCTPCI